MPNLTVTTQNVVHAIQEALLAGIAAFEKVGKLYVKAITENPDMKQIIQEAIPEISPSTWTRFELLGRGQAIAQLVYDNSFPARRLIRCPVSEQEKYLNQPLILLLDGGDTLQVNLHHLSKDQTEQVFAHDHIREIDEQKTWMKQKEREIKQQKAYEIEVPAWEIYRKKVRIKKDVELTLDQILDIAKQMRK